GRFLYNSHQVNNDLSTPPGQIDASRIGVTDYPNIYVKPFLTKQCSRFFGPDNGNNLVIGSCFIYPANQADSQVSVRACYQ
ncbi:MAG TPA: hypothetical protein DCS89_12430, partial [Gammaproteobacteria bacterium]|nr:hypothetical protein [Gammaproteobacteria bacterium]